MKWILLKSTYLALIGVFSLLISSSAAFIWGFIKTVYLIQQLILTAGKENSLLIQFILIVDSFLIATTLLIFAMSLYELFIEPVEQIPTWMIARNLNDLKSKLSSMIVLVMGVTFLETLLASTDHDGHLKTGIATSMVAAVLIAFGYFEKK